MPDLNSLLKAAKDKTEPVQKKKLSRGVRPDHVSQGILPSQYAGGLPTHSPVANSAIANNSTEDTLAQSSAMVKFSIAESAVENLATANTTIEEFTTEQSAIADLAIEKIAIARNTTEESATANQAIADSTTADDNAKKATKVEFAIAKTTIAELADKKGGYTRIDNYVFDVMLPKIGSAAASVVFLYLWRRSLGFQKLSVHLSHQIIADAVGLSKRAVQEAIARLNDLELVRTYRAYDTAIPEHFILRPWDKKESVPAMEENSIADSAVAQKDQSYSRNFHTAIAESATNKRNVLNKEINSLSQDFPEALLDRWRGQTEKKEKRERAIYLSLCRKFGEEAIRNEIVEIINDVFKNGLRDGSKALDIMAILEVDYPWFAKRTQENLHKERKIQSREVATHVLSKLKEREAE